ncbi:MAG: radical SAM family heme chaperone HemW [Chloroflexi bacterium]|nr:radical SAM family heme chaperone HemW [Chloroflexota bacterium]
MRGIYIHVPFCVKKCDYCDFYSLPTSPGFRQSYVQALLREAEAHAGMSFKTLYLGGGTPSLLGAGLLSDLIRGLRHRLNMSDVVEATIEVNPESATPELLGAAGDSGINRVSIGVQSLDDSELKAVGRIHTASQALETVKLVKHLGFKSISADIIIGLPGQTWQTLSRSLETMVDSGIEHISLYCLSLEEGTLLAKNPPADLPSDDMQAELFQRASGFLEVHDYIHYEVSNFALEGHQCRHNLNYWRGGEYLGLGPAAASHLAGRRFRNRADLAAYLEKPAELTEDSEELSPKDKAAEEAMLRLRLLVEGVDVCELMEKFGRCNTLALARRLELMVSQGQLVADGFRYRLPPSRVLTSNAILAEVVEADNPV